MLITKHLIYLNNVDVRVDIGTCYRHSGIPDKAVDEYGKALQLNTEHQYGQKYLAVVLADDLKENAQAIKKFEKYLELVPTHLIKSRSDRRYGILRQ